MSSTPNSYSMSKTYPHPLSWASASIAMVLLGIAAHADSPNKTDAINAAAPPPVATIRPFGIAPAGITSPEMGEAVKRMDQASVLEGHKSSITRFRWSNDAPPKLWFAGLWGSQVTNELIALTAHTPDIWDLELHEAHIDDQGMAYVAKLPKLRYLRIDPIERWAKPGFPTVIYSFPTLEPVMERPRVTSKSLTLFAGSPSLEGLSLLDAIVTSADLAALSSLPKLSELSLPNAIDEEVVKCLQACRRLNRLTIGYREISADEIRRLSAWKGLRKLTLTHAALSDEALTALEKLDGVTLLELSMCGLTDERLAFLHVSPSVTTLSLGENDIAGPGLKYLAHLRLATLGLAHNNVSDATLPMLPQLVSVENLVLEGCVGVTDAGIRSGVLQSMSHLKELQLRDLKKVTDASLDDLVKFGHLKTLNVRAAGVSWDGVDRMKKAMPNTFIFK